jgi:hypothetical protein
MTAVDRPFHGMHVSLILMLTAFSERPVHLSKSPLARDIFKVSLQSLSPGQPIDDVIINSTMDLLYEV